MSDGAQTRIPGWEGTQGPFAAEYSRPHVYARDISSGAGNCVCGGDLGDDRHVQAAPGVPVPDRLRRDAARSSDWDRAGISRVGPQGYEHGWIFVGKPGEGTGGGRSFAEGHPADRLTIAGSPKTVAAGMSDEDLGEADREFGRRAALLGRAGAVSKTHQLVKAELQRRNGGRTAGRLADWDPDEYITRLDPADGAGGDEDDDEPQRCPACGHLNPPGALFCSQCGAMLPDPGDDEDDQDDEGDAEDAETDASRFDPAEARGVGGEWTAGGGSPAAAKTAPAAKPAAAAKQGTAAGAGTAREKAAQKAGLLKQAAQDRDKAKELGKELGVLEHQQAQQSAAAKKAAATSKKAAASAKKAGKATALKTKTKSAARKTKRAASLKSRISHMRGQIADLNKQAAALTAQASRL